MMTTPQNSQHGFPSNKKDPVVTYEPEFHMYICKQAPSFKFRLIDGPPEDVYAQFNLGVWKTKDAELARIMDSFLMNAPHVSAMVQKVNWEEARRVATQATIAHQEKTRSIKGATSTTELNRAKASTTIDEQVHEMRSKGVSEEKIKDFVTGLKAVGLDGVSVEVNLPEEGNVVDPTLTGEAAVEGIVKQPVISATPTRIVFGAGAKAS